MLPFPSAILLPRLFFWLVLTQTTKTYKCALILSSRIVDPLRDKYMAEGEANTQDYFQEIKETQQIFCHRWKELFEISVDEYIKERLKEAEFVPKMVRMDEREKRISLHAIRRLVAGADQEWELAQQPEYAAKCAKIDGALVWQGRGYVILMRFPPSS
jgi:hypothetical protein